MINLKKNTLVFIVVLIQTFAAISSGFIALYITGSKNMLPATYVGSVDIGNLTDDKAEEKLGAFYEDWASKQKITIKVEGEPTEFDLDLSEVKATVDYKTTLENIKKDGKTNFFTKMIKSYFLGQKTDFSPSVTFDEAILKEKLNDIAAFIYKEPLNAKIYLKNKEIVKVSGENGRRINLYNAVNKVKSELGKGYTETIQFSFSDKYELEELVPIARTEDFENVEEIISSYSTEIKSVENLESIKNAVSAIDRVLVYAVDPATGEQAGVFSFNKYLSKEGLLKEQNDEGYNQVASTLHAAVVLAEIESKGIVRFQHKSKVDYIEPGLDVKVFGSSEDYKFRNSLDNNVVILAEIKNNKVVVNLLGKKKNKDISTEIRSNVVKREEAGVIEVEHPGTEPGKSELVSNGTEGVVVDVYRILLKDGRKEAEQLLYTNKYEPKSAVVQVAPNSIKNRSAK